MSAADERGDTRMRTSKESPQIDTDKHGSRNS